MHQDQDMLNKSEMDVHVQNGTFRLAFVGMSNAGKSYLSRQLQEQAGFMWYEVDQEIANQLGLGDVSEVAEWMGQPGDAQYEEHEKIYSQKEEKCTHLHHLDTNGKNLVFDTTGSVIYLSQDALDWLHEDCFIVHIDVGEDSIPDMLEQYLQEPKPVSWDGLLQPESGESEAETLRRCYPLLVKDRLSKYRAFAHISIPVKQLYNISAAGTLDAIRSYLPE